MADSVTNADPFRGRTAVILLLVVFLCAAGYLAFSVWAGWGNVTTAIGRIGIGGALAVFALSLVNYFLRFVRWQYYMKLFGRKVPMDSNLRIYLAGFALTVTPGKVGESVRSLFLKTYGVPYRESLAFFAAERLSDLIAIMLLAMVGIASYPPARPLVLSVATFVLIVLLLVGKPDWMRKVSQAVDVRLPGRIASWGSTMMDLIYHFSRCFTMRTMSYALLLGMVAWGAEALSLYLVAFWLGSEITLTTAVFVYAFAMIVGALSFLPGGLGGTEAVMVGLLMLNGLTVADATAATILVRVATLWFAVALGLMAWPARRPK